MSPFVDRMIGAARLDPATFEAVEHDAQAMPQALGVVALAALAAGIGAVGFGGLFALGGVIAALLGWAIWAGLIWLIGTKLLPEAQTDADWAQVARVTGFAQAPGLLRLFGFLPLIGGLVVLVANIWMLVAMVVAVRQVLDYRDTWRAVLVVLVGWLINVLVFVALLPFSTLG